jgi:hypothetical protein
VTNARMHICSSNYSLYFVITHSNFLCYSICSHETCTSVLFVVILTDYLDYKSTAVVGFKNIYLKRPLNCLLEPGYRSHHMTIGNHICLYDCAFVLQKPWNMFTWTFSPRLVKYDYRYDYGHMTMPI